MNLSITKATANALAQKSTRASNLEALRIVAMFMIVAYHFAITYHEHSLAGYSFLVFTAPFLHVSNNLFFLISGWFLIKSSFKAALHLVLICLFFNIILIIVGLALGWNITFSEIWKGICFPITAPDYWFLKVYLVLIILAPILNPSLKKIDFRTYTFVLIGLLITCGVSTMVDRDSHANPMGMSSMQGIWVYMTGYWLRRFKPVWEKISGTFLLLGYLALSTIGAVLFLIFDSRWELNSSPFVYFASIAFFLYFTKLSFNSRLVNSFAVCIIGVYLVHTSSLIAYDLKADIEEFYLANIDYLSLGGKILYVTAGSALFFIIFCTLSVILTPGIKRLSDNLSTRCDQYWQRLKLRLNAYVDKHGLDKL